MDYLENLQRPRVVAIIKPQTRLRTIKLLLPVLFTSESQLTFSEKISRSFFRQSSGWLRSENGSLMCGSNPWLYARLVSGLFVETYEDTHWRQTLHWDEPARSHFDGETNNTVEVMPKQPRSEEVHFDVLWYGKSFLDEDESR